MTDKTRTLILTGASRGIGHATVRRFSEAGWRIITCSRDEVPEACRFDPNWAHHIPTDLGDAGDLEAFIDKANEHIGDGGLAALVNNAAVSPKSPTKNALAALTATKRPGAKYSS